MKIRPVVITGWIIATISWVVLWVLLIMQFPDYAGVMKVFLLVTVLLWWLALYFVFRLERGFFGDEGDQ